MSTEDIKRIKKKLKLDKIKSSGFDKLLKLINLIYYENKIYVEEYNDDEKMVSYFFDDGTVIRLYEEETLMLASFLLELSLDVDEQTGHDFNIELN